MKFMRYTLVVVAALILVLTVVIQIFYADSPRERQKQASLLLEQEQTILENYAYQFAELNKVMVFAVDSDLILLRFEEPGQLRLKILVINQKESKYYIEGSDEYYGSMEQALTLLGLTKDQMMYWVDVLQKYNLYELRLGWDKEYLEFVFNRFHMIPHGLIYVFRCEDQGQFISEIPGRIRGKDSAFYDIMAYLGHRWFYFEGP